MTGLTTVRQILNNSPTEAEVQSLSANMPSSLVVAEWHLENDVPEPGLVTLDNTFLTEEMARIYMDYVVTQHTPIQIFIL